jgi:hypothetical protein
MTDWKCKILQQNDGHILSAKHELLHFTQRYFSLLLRGISHLYSEVFLTLTQRYFSLQIAFHECTFVKLQTCRERGKKGRSSSKNFPQKCRKKGTSSTFQIHRWGTSCGKGKVADRSRPSKGCGRRLPCDCLHFQNQQLQARVEGPRQAFQCVGREESTGIVVCFA